MFFQDLPLKIHIMMIARVLKIEKKLKSLVKVLLDEKSSDSDGFIRDMVAKIKIKFDKYWGETNLLMSIAVILDPRCKMKALEFCFLELYSSKKVEREISSVRKALHELYSEYALLYNNEGESCGQIQGGSSQGQGSSNVGISKETVQALMCGEDWLRKRFGVKKKTKNEKKMIHVVLPSVEDASGI
ncbi:Zinc finger BED domain-containing protein RICESLEEPER 4 [Sesamum alatum]|uniref:Zinc finger BED domain-containing protein RICESLEEPER 4 n=1 Tax=Sesamum alatum TaxID=300844 RepID=A0AAE2CLT6_9LAMI|nr:Zinc finger BED domain-containing protein RICESLEEPER 4 [Sesamum alatum]